MLHSNRSIDSLSHSALSFGCSNPNPNSTHPSILPFKYYNTKSCNSNTQESQLSDSVCSLGASSPIWSPKQMGGDLADSNNPVKITHSYQLQKNSNDGRLEFREGNKRSQRQLYNTQRQVEDESTKQFQILTVCPKFFKKTLDSPRVWKQEKEPDLEASTHHTARQAAKYFPTQPSGGVNHYYVSDLVRSYSDTASPIHDHFKGCHQLAKNLQRLVPSDNIVPLNLPQESLHLNRKTLVFDLDETLVHCTKTNKPPYDIRLQVVRDGKEPVAVGFNIRPYAIQMLQNLSKHFQLIIFTASYSYYADTILNYLDPERRLFQHRLYREHCQEPLKGYFVKDLRVIPRNLNNIVLIDNSSMSYHFQQDNGIPMISYIEGKEDCELMKLEQYLMKLRFLLDVRKLNKRVFRISEQYFFDTAEEAVRELFICPK